ncbi:hypothetical protein CR513_58507, partial [Mucuna pruriens]
MFVLTHSLPSRPYQEKCDGSLGGSSLRRNQQGEGVFDITHVATRKHAAKKLFNTSSDVEVVEVMIIIPWILERMIEIGKGWKNIYKKMVKENPGESLFLRNYDKFLYQVLLEYWKWKKIARKT